MKTNMYVIHDSKAENYGLPLFFINDEIAIRAATDAANNLDHDYGKHSHDFNLFHIGHYDDEKAFTHGSAPVHLVNLNDLKHK